LGQTMMNYWKIYENKKKPFHRGITFKATLDKGSKSMVKWNWGFLLVKSFKLVPRFLVEGPWPRQIKLWFSLHDIILKGKFKESLCFGESKCKLRFQVVHFFSWVSFFSVFFYPCCSIFVTIENMLWIEDIVQNTSTPPFLTNF